MSVIFKEQRYADLDITFGRNPVTQKLNVLTNADAVKQAVKILVLSNFYERVGRTPYLGGHVGYHLFESLSPITASNIRDYIKRVINNHEPRAKLISVFVTPNHDLNQFDVKIVFRPINLTDAVTVELFLKKVR